MAFQPSGSCSSSPYKCLYLISSELYNSLLNNKTRCEDKGNASSNSSSYSAPNIHNNFYPSNGVDFKPIIRNKTPERAPPPNLHLDDPPAPPDSHPPPPGLSPPPHISPNTDDTPDNADQPPLPNGAITQTSSSKMGSIESSEADTGEGEINGLVSGVGNQISYPPVPNSIKTLNRLARYKKKVSKKRRRPLRHSDHNPPPQPPPQNIPHQIPPVPSLPKEEPMDHTTTSVPAAPKVEPLSTPVTKSTSKLKTELKFPSYEDRKPDIKPTIKKEVKKEDKINKPLVKRKTKFERNLPDVMELDDEEPNIPSTSKPTPTPNPLKWPSLDERKPDIMFTNKKPAAKNSRDKKALVKRQSKFERNLPDIIEIDEDQLTTQPPQNIKPKIKDEVKMKKGSSLKKDLEKNLPLEKTKWIRTPPEMDTSEDVRETHQNEFKMRFRGAPYIDKLPQRKYPQIKKAEKVPKVEKKPNHLKHKPQIESQVKGPIKVRRDIFIDSKEKVKDRMRVSMFKAKNGSEKKSAEKKKSLIKSPKTEVEENDVDFIDIPYMPEHAAPSENISENATIKKNKSFQRKKRVIENHPNASTARALKKEMMEEMEHESSSSKRKNKFPTHPTGPIKFLRTKETQKGKRKNNFGTHPTGPIKFIKSKHEKLKGKNENDKDEEGETTKRLKKVYGSGFKLWKI